jgi:uncharacterized protein YdeI (YjbR/CyaY-like superfamily)
MKKPEYIYFKNREELRNWLQEYHAKSNGIWILFYRKHLNMECINYKDALEELLCFGWIDSIIKKLDNDKYVRKITPRTNIKKWSELNLKIVSELIKNDRMTQAGLNKIGINIRSETPGKEIKEAGKKEKNEIDIPDFIVSEFARNEPALINFNNLATTYKKHYILWITSAKKSETVNKRLKESIRLLMENQKLGLK